MTGKYRQAIIVVATLLALVGIGALASQVAQRHPKVTTETNQVKPLSYQGEAGKTVLELLERNHVVQKQDTAYGTFVTSIDGVVQSENAFWLYYIDGSAATEAADKAVTQDGQTIEWRYETF